MTVREIIEGLDSFTKEMRIYNIGRLLLILTPVTHATMKQFKKDWEGLDTEEFDRALDICLEEYVKMECSPFGAEVREYCKLEPLTMETEV